jgi:hypothetical protein
MGRAPDHDSGKFQARFTSALGSAPYLADHYLVILSDHVFDRHVDVRKLLVCAANILLSALRTGWHCRGHVGAVVDKFGCEMHNGDVEVLLD